VALRSNGAVEKARSNFVVLANAGHVALFTTLGFLVSFMMHRLQQSYCIQRDALAAAKAREEQLQTITDAMPALIAYVDADHRFRFNNKGYQEWFALSRDELLGKHAREVLGEDVYRQLMPRIETALSGQPVSFETEIPYLAAGTRHVSAHYVPDRSSDGTIRGYFALVQDISERIHREQLLADAKLRLSIAMRVGRSGAFEWDIEKETNTWSDELLELHGLQPGEFKGTNEAWLECIHPDDVQRALATAERALKEGEGDVEYRIRRRDTGETRWLQGRGKVFYDAAHNPVRMVGINVDVTERKRAEEALREADRRKDEFIAMLAHRQRHLSSNGVGEYVSPLT